LVKIPQAEKIIVVNIRHHILIPKYYLNRDIPLIQINEWSQLNTLAADTKFSARNGSIYFVFYPGKNPVEGFTYLKNKFPSLKQVAYIRPSVIDATLNLLNPDFNHSKRAYIYSL
jgi:hypothetical protein